MYYVLCRKAPSILHMIYMKYIITSAYKVNFDLHRTELNTHCCFALYICAKIVTDPTHQLTDPVLTSSTTIAIFTISLLHSATIC